MLHHLSLWKKGQLPGHGRLVPRQRVVTAAAGIVFTPNTAPAATDDANANTNGVVQVTPVAQATTSTRPVAFIPTNTRPVSNTAVLTAPTNAVTFTPSSAAAATFTPTTPDAAASATSGIPNTTNNGTNINVGAITAPTSTSGPSAGTIAGIVIVLLIALGLAGFFGYRHHKKKQRENASPAALSSSFNGGKRLNNGNFDSFDDLLGAGAAASGAGGAAGYEKYGAMDNHGMNNLGNSTSGRNNAQYGNGNGQEWNEKYEQDHLRASSNNNNPFLNHGGDFAAAGMAGVAGYDAQRQREHEYTQQQMFLREQDQHRQQQQQQDRQHNLYHSQSREGPFGDYAQAQPQRGHQQQQSIGHYPPAQQQQLTRNISGNGISMGYGNAPPTINTHVDSTTIPVNHTSPVNRINNPFSDAEAISPTKAAASGKIPLPITPVSAIAPYDTLNSAPVDNKRLSAASIARAAAPPATHQVVTLSQLKAQQEREAAAQNAGQFDETPATSTGPFADPTYSSKIYIVTRTFEPSMSDELVVMPGDRIQVVMEYDDGWCLGVNLDSVEREKIQEPRRGVFPRDCIEDILPQGDAAAAQAQHDATGEDIMMDQPLTTGPVILERAPTLPMLDMDTSRFSISGSSARTRPSSTISRATVVPSNTQAGLDAYGGVTSASPSTATFPANVQQLTGGTDNKPRDSLSATTIAHRSLYASSTILDEFPSTPNTAFSRSPVVTPSFRMGETNRPGSVSIVDDKNRLSVNPAIFGVPKSPTASSFRSVNRTSSLIASKDADAFLSNSRTSTPRPMSTA